MEKKEGQKFISCLHFVSREKKGRSAGCCKKLTRR